MHIIWQYKAPITVPKCQTYETEFKDNDTQQKFNNHCYFNVKTNYTHAHRNYIAHNVVQACKSHRITLMEYQWVLTTG